MSTVLGRFTGISLLLAGCSHTGRAPLQVVPAPPDSVASRPAARQWKEITVDGPYGPFVMQVPVIMIAGAPGESASILVDSVALRQVEHRLTARIANIARAEAAALRNDTTPSVQTARHPITPIKPGLLGAISFANDSLVPTLQGRERLIAVARLAEDLPGALEIVAVTEGTGAAVFDVALARARRVYLGLLEAAPALAQREVQLTVRTRVVNPGAPHVEPVVEVFSASQR